MIVKLNLDRGTCKVIREDTDRKYRAGGWANAESTFLYHVKKELIKQGFDVVKIRMNRDGHLVDDLQQYIRSRSGLSRPGEFAIYNDQYSIFDAGLRLNEQGEIDLTVIKA